ncbi:hypothetical protein BDF21DRAFT_333516 [Thamnidium elegans]|uniref:GDP/GTP exchange factor Sec2 N-terminal domain-containing protein n=1 Tax=Thamnidium elegans TaxID=101142 RepID=A0A8H7STJ5_9FUNG|nr:hypothetical protein INT48_000697 [Thamnidium elegans]KAI8090364.1 hypothetical protein BDF21DRAFT_333516 [Thamnidium elegans]
MIDNVPKTSRTDPDGTSSSSAGSTDHWHPSFPITPTTSSNLLPSSKSLPLPSARTLPAPKEPDCPCHHILVSKDSKHCALCDDIVPILSELQQDRQQKREEIKEYKNSLALERDQSKGFEDELSKVKQQTKDLTTKLETTTNQYHSLQKDISILNQKYKNEQVETEKAKQAKKELENELEELSQKLFEEANGMVANEKREKHQIEIQYKHLQQELKHCKEQLEADEAQLRELKLKMGDMEDQRKRENRLSALSGLYSNNNNSSEDQQQQLSVQEENDETEQRASRDLASLFTQEEYPEQQIDPIVLNEFEEFVKMENNVPIRKLHTIPYMKNSLIEDVEPCLRFGPSSRLSARKLVEAIALNTCFIEESPFGFSQEQAKRPFDVPLKISATKNMIWERLSSTPAAPFAGCQACGRNNNNNNLPYRFRISVLDDWACIDRYCRDRLVAVCEFYLFIRNVRQGYYNGRTIPDLYHESTRLKLQMFYARMGTLSQTLQNIGVKGDIVGQASAPNMIIPPPIIITTDTSKQEEEEEDDDDKCSVSSNEDDEYFQDDVIEKPRRTSTHPGNSVWVEHSFL